MVHKSFLFEIENYKKNIVSISFKYCDSMISTV